MDPFTLVVIACVMAEVGFGGPVTSSVIGGATAAAKAAASEAQSGFSGWYAERAKKLGDTRWGRFRLRQESRAAGTAAFVGKGLKAGVKAAPSGAKRGRAKGRQVRDSATATGRAKLADGTAKVRGRFGGTGAGDDSGEDVQAAQKRCVQCGRVHPSAWGDDCPLPNRNGYAVDSMDPTKAKRLDPEADVVAEPGRVDALYATDAELRRLAAGGNRDAAKELMRRQSEREQQATDVSPAKQESARAKTTPAPSEGDNKGDNMTDAADFPAEKVGAAEYVPAWDTPGPQLELTMASLTTLVEEMTRSAEANSHHEVGGVEDVTGKGQAAVEALQAFGEAIGVHAKALHDEHDDVIEKAKSGKSESQQEYVGAH